MTELRDRMDHLAAGATEDVTLRHPTDGASPGRRPHRLAWAGVAAVLTIVVGLVGLIAANRDDGERVASGPSTSEPGPAGDRAAVVAVVPDPRYWTEAQPDLTVTFRDSAGRVVGERTWSEVWPSSGRQPSGGLLQRLPAPAPYTIRVSAPGIDLDGCELDFDVEGGAELVVTLVRDGPTCGSVQSARDWAGPSSEIGSRYVGLTEAEAGRAAAADGYTPTRVTGRDGLGLLVTLDLEPNRLNIVTFDEVVLAARLDSG